MKNNKNIIAISLATTLAMTPMTILASDNKEALNQEDVIISMEIKDEDVLKKERIFNSTIGKIEKVNLREDGSVSILVNIKLDDNKTDQMIYLIGEETLVLNGEEKIVVEPRDLKEGMEITTFYNRNTPVAMSLPAQMTPRVVVIDNKDWEKQHDVFVDRFNEDLVNAVNSLKLNISEDTKIVNEKGEKVEDIKNKDLIVFFTATTKSIPAQTTPIKIIVLDEYDKVEEEKEEEKQVELSHEKIIINGEEVLLEDEMYVLEETEMIPLREIVEKLGYEVKWNGEDFSIEITKGPQWSKITVGKNQYNFAKMNIELERAPELKAGKTFVPMSFLEEILKLEKVEVNKEGILEIK